LEIVWTDIALSAGMFALMFAMGLSLGTDDFRRIAKSPRATLVGTTAQLIVMPVVGIGLSNLLGLSPLLSTGLVVISACPGGMFSHMYVHFARANTALSITLPATATLVTLFTLPLWVQYSLTSFAPEGAAQVDMPVLDTALRLSTLTILPVAIGMFARAKRPSLLRFERRLSIFAALLIVSVAVSDATSRPDIPLETFIEAFYAAAWFAAAAIAVGIILPAIFRIPARAAVTIGVELIVKNTLLGIVLVGQAMDFEALIPIFAFATLPTPGGLILLVGWRVLEKRGYFGPRSDWGDEEAAVADA